MPVLPVEKWCCGFGVYLRLSARDTGVSSLVIDWVLLCEYSLADSADLRRQKTGWGNETNNNNGRSRVSRGNKIQKQKKNGLYCSRIFGTAIMKPHLKMHGKTTRKLREWNFMLAFLGTFRCVSCRRFLKLKRITQANFLIKNFGCTQHSSSKLDSVFAGTKFPLFLNFISARNAWTAVKSHKGRASKKNGKNKERSIKQKGKSNVRARKERAYLTDRLSPLAWYSLADNADLADECSRLHYFAEKEIF